MKTAATKQVGVVSLMVSYKKMKSMSLVFKAGTKFPFSENLGNSIFTKEHIYIYLRINAYLLHILSGVVTAVRN
jgi:hypothetical protein